MHCFGNVVVKFVFHAIIKSMKKTFRFASAFRACHFAGAGLLLGCILGIGTSVSAAPATFPSNRPVESLEPDAAEVKELLAMPLTELPAIKPSDSGPGVMVCEPQAPAGGEAMAFGMGCGRWLRYQVGGQPRFGKNLYWGNYSYGLQQINLENGIPTQAQALEMGKIEAQTHVATGTLEGTPEQGTLTYRLWKLPEKQVVGEPIVVKGNRSQIVAGLPTIAKTIVARLYGEVALVPATVELSAQQLTQLGELPRDTIRPLPDDQAQKLQALAALSPVAGFTYINHLYSVQERDPGVRAKTNLRDASLQMARQAGQNTLALAFAGPRTTDVAGLTPYWQPLAARYPNNYLLTSLDIFRHALRGDRAAQRKAVLRGLATNPSSAWPWLDWAEVLSNEASDVRKGRYYKQMNETEREYINERYSQMIDASLKAVKCNPRNASAWQSLTRAATFASDHYLSDVAVRQVFALPTHDHAAYNWGFEMFQSKWQKEPAKLRRVAQLLAANPERFIDLYFSALSAFRESEMYDDAREYEALSTKILHEWVEQHPQDRYARYTYGNRLSYAANLDGATQQFQWLIKNYPTEEEGYFGMAAVYEQRKDWPKVAQSYQEALKYEPDHPSANFNCGEAFYEMKQYDQAQQYYQKAIDAYPHYARAYSRLGDIQYAKASYVEAEKLYRKATELNPDEPSYRKNMERSQMAQIKRPGLSGPQE